MTYRDDAARELLERLYRPPFTNLPKSCSSDHHPGYDETPEAQDWSIRPTTEDQSRIEEQLAGLATVSSRILHIGAGNSSLARRFAPQVASVFGTTIHAEEIRFAERLGLKNYAVFLKNKFSRDMDTIPRGFDFIVDNNPSSFACCLFHFCRMMVSYAELLEPGGMILTAEPGLSFVVKSNPEQWSLTWTEWAYLADLLRMPASQLTEFVYAMQRPPAAAG